jgi:hypothetical protein
MTFSNTCTARCPVTLRTGWFLLHLGTHLAFHLGQAGYLRRMITGDSASTSPISLKVLGDRLNA